MELRLPWHNSCQQFEICNVNCIFPLSLISSVTIIQIPLAENDFYWDFSVIFPRLAGVSSARIKPWYYKNVLAQFRLEWFSLSILIIIVFSTTAEKRTILSKKCEWYICSNVCGGADLNFVSKYYNKVFE